MNATGAAVDRARRKLMIWAGIVAAGVIILIVAAVVMSGDDESETDDPLSVTECNDRQEEFDNQSEINDLADPGSATFDRSLARMDQIDRQLKAGGCYDR